MAKLTYGKGNYYIEYLAAYDEKDLRREYARLREVALKRLERFSRSEFAGSKIYMANKNRYQLTAEQIPTKERLVMMLADLGTFIGSEAGSVRGLQGIRKRSIEKLHENGFTFVTRANYDAWVKFIDWYKDNESSKFYPTPEAMREMVKEVNKGMSPQEAYEKFSAWQNERGAKTPGGRKRPGHLGMRDPLR